MEPDRPFRNDGSRFAYAGFLQRLAAGNVRVIEWKRFAVQHYSDELLEDIRRKTVRLAIGQAGGFQWSDAEIAAFQQWSRELRSEQLQARCDDQ